VVTTYGTVQGELRQKYPVLQRCQWLRVILDEAHCIRNQRTLASKACCSLKATHRWCVSGTIIQNSLDDVFGIMKFLQHEPWCLPSFWKTAITRPFQPEIGDVNTSIDPKSRDKSLKAIIERVRRVLNPIMIRRTKDSLTKEGLPILTLPPIESKVIRIDFSESEREFYNAVLARSLEVFDGFIKEGTASRAYFQIFSLLSRLRQACDHIALTVKSKIDDDDWLSAKKQQGNDNPSSTRTKAAEPENGSDVLGPQFLDDLLKKFYEQQMSPRKTGRQDSLGFESSAKRRKVQSFASTIAHTVSEAIEDNATHMHDECPICLERPEIGTAVLTPCAHIFCRRCLLGVLRSQASSKSNIRDALGCPDGVCPTCQEKVDARRIIALTKSCNGDDSVGCVTSTYLSEGKAVRKADRTIKQHVLETQDGNPFAVARQILEDAVSSTESSKLNAIMNELNEVWKQDPGSKVLIFSHYLGFLDLLGAQCDTAGIPYFRLDGSLNIRERMTVLDDFRRSETPVTLPNSIHKGTVLLMSMSAGGEGLNIVSASSCFIVEPW
jgi:DNA repair protein RAD5